MRRAIVIGTATCALVAIVSLCGCTLPALMTKPAKTRPNSSSKPETDSATPAPRVWNDKVLGTPVHIYNSEASPGRVYIKVGASVTWVNHDKVARNVFLAPNWTAPTTVVAVIPPGGHFSQKFNQAGTYSYRDPNNPVLVGQVVVQ
jgi:plastocyanin